ncbi:receptor-type protein kinase, putative [Bodo saltans]|uniref:Receptor-type protein kinase, putative n=1 Tax=Bodo saltans TaxID=75058 RepID=A0A0S4IJ26_BODSA|nr:receptor-type protein kinase, putative [Bodo saltans]|eukprot:CUE74318.1 receptor-type protein kinase, putative [Bodo saltans]
MCGDHSTFCGQQSLPLAANKVRLGKYLTPQPAIKRSLTVLLRHLDLRGCVNITNIGLKCVFSLQQLQHLVVCRCDQITDSGLGSIFLLRHLRHLDLSLCNKITDAGLANVFSLSSSCGISFSL